MTDQIVLRDVSRIVLPFGIFVGVFSHGAVSAAGFALGALCVWLWTRATPANRLERA
jgi:hypothetical protein